MDATWLLISCSWKALVLIAIGAILIRVWPKTSAAERHSSWAALLASLVVLPVLSLLWAYVSLPKLFADGLAEQVLSQPAGTVITVFGEAESSLPWGALIASIWAAGAGLVMLRFAAGVQAARRFLAGATAWMPRVSGWNGQALVVCSPVAHVPMAIGILRPRIVLPISATSWPEDTLLRVLTHEAEHIRREDGLWKLAAAFVSAIYWFHPAVWYALRAIELEREHACDDAVLATGQPPTQYADDLITFARRSSRQAIPASAVPMATPSSLETRIAAILDNRKQRQTLRRTIIMLYTLTLLALLLPLSALQSLGQNQPLERDTANASSAARPAAAASPADIQAARAELAELDREVSRLAANAAAEPAPHAMPVPVAQSNDEKPRKIRVGGTAQELKVLVKVPPKYPPSAKEEGVQGLVRLEVTINKAGNVRDIEIIESPDNRLSEASVEAVSQWSYEPTHLNGEPVEVLTTVDINFTLAK